MSTHVLMPVATHILIRLMFELYPFHPFRYLHVIFIVPVSNVPPLLFVVYQIYGFGELFMSIHVLMPTVTHILICLMF